MLFYYRRLLWGDSRMLRPGGTTGKYSTKELIDLVRHEII